MTGGRERFIQQLDGAADRVGDVPQHELVALLRRASLRLRNDEDHLVLDPATEEAVANLAAALGKPKHGTIRMVLHDWLTTNGYLSRNHVLDDSDEAPEPDGAA